MCKALQGSGERPTTPWSPGSGWENRAVPVVFISQVPFRCLVDSYSLNRYDRVSRWVMTASAFHGRGN